MTRSAGIHLAAVGLATSAGLLVVAMPSATATLLLTLIAAILLLLLRRKLAPSWMSPVHLAAISYALLGLVGATLYALVSAAPEGSSVAVRLSPAESVRTTQLLLVCSVGVLVGALSFLIVRRPPTLAPLSALISSVSLSRRTQALLMLSAALVLVALTLSYGLADLWSRPIYIREHVQDRPLYGLLSQLSAVMILILGHLLVSRSGMWWRLTACTLIAGYVAVFFAVGSRRLSLVPVLLALGAYSANVASRRLRIALVGSLFVSFALLRLPLFLRARSTHGFAPYLQQLGDYANYPVGLDSLTLNIVVSFAIIGAAAFQQNSVSLGDLWTSVNPLPGRWAGWYDVAPTLRFNEYTPYPGVGELGNTGWVMTLLYFVLAGAFLAYLDLRVRVLLQRGHQIFGLSLVGMAALFVLFSVQYNLRSATRALYYAIVLDIGIRLWSYYSIRRAGSQSSEVLTSSSTSATMV